MAYGLAVDDPEDEWLIQGYNPDPHARTWYGPVAAKSPAWSPDGTKLMYIKDGQIRIDQQDGTAPTVLPLNHLEYPIQATDCKWAPDGQHIVYTVTAPSDGPGFYLVVSKADGTEVQPVSLGDSDAWTTGMRSPDWSPDGKLIAYSMVSENPGQGLSVSEPSGANRRLVLATSIDGYTDATVQSLDRPAWSPNGAKLAVSFEAVRSDKTLVHGIGTISPQGGALHPVFISPAGLPANASASSPVWAPDGQTILFTCAPAPATAAKDGCEENLVNKVDVWSVNADGSGSPTRLTYDYGCESKLSWWMEKAFADVYESYWAFDAIKACRDASLVQGYLDGSFGPELVISRDQMAVYLARALAGGEAKVPAVITKPSFKDVPSSYWAFKYIEYCLKHKVVTLGTGHYLPSATVNRGLMAMSLARAMAPESQRPGLTGYVPPATASFGDVPKSDAAYKYVEYLHAHGVVIGGSDGDYHENDAVNRAQLAVFVARGFGLTD